MHGGHLRLLQHDLGDPDAIGRALALPGQIVPAVARVPGDQSGRRSRAHPPRRTRQLRIASKILASIGRSVAALSVGSRTTRHARPSNTHCSMTARLRACSAREPLALGARHALQRERQVLADGLILAAHDRARSRDRAPTRPPAQASGRRSCSDRRAAASARTSRAPRCTKSSRVLSRRMVRAAVGLEVLLMIACTISLLPEK